MAARLRAAAKRGLALHRIDAGGDDWLISAPKSLAVKPSAWVNSLGEVALAVAKAKATSAPAGVTGSISPVAQAIADSLLSGETGAVFLGSAAIAHPNASDLHVLAQFIAEQTGATFGFLPVGGNAVGASLVNANGAGINSVLSGERRAVILMNLEPTRDLANPEQAKTALAKANTVIALTAFTSPDLLETADVILPISTFTETVATFVNAEGCAQTIQPAVKPLGDSRPGWKVLRVLGSLLGLDGFLFNMPEEVLGDALGESFVGKLNNQFTGTPAVSSANAAPTNSFERVSDVNIYAVDPIVRRAPALQRTSDAKRGGQVGLNQAAMNDLGVKEGDVVTITQGGLSAQLPVSTEATLAAGAVRISSGTAASAQLGAMFGSITLSKA